MLQKPRKWLNICAYATYALDFFPRDKQPGLALIADMHFFKHHWISVV